MAEWQTHEPQKLGPSWAWEFESPLGDSVIGFSFPGVAGAQPAFIRLAGPVRYRDLGLAGGPVLG